MREPHLNASDSRIWRHDATFELVLHPADFHQYDEAMACPVCGGADRDEIAPGFWRCRSASTETRGTLGHEPGRPWQQRPEFHEVHSPCGHEYQEGPGVTVETCDCSTFAIGTCSNCGKFVCGEHSAIRDEKRLCISCTSESEQSEADEKAIIFFDGMKTRLDREVGCLKERLSRPGIDAEERLVVAVHWFCDKTYNSSFFGALYHQARNTEELRDGWTPVASYGVRELERRTAQLGARTDEYRDEFESRTFAAFLEILGDLITGPIDESELRRKIEAESDVPVTEFSWPWHSERIASWTLSRLQATGETPRDGRGVPFLKERQLRRAKPTEKFYSLNASKIEMSPDREVFIRGDGAAVNRGIETELNPHCLALIVERVRIPAAAQIAD